MVGGRCAGSGAAAPAAGGSLEPRCRAALQSGYITAPGPLEKNNRWSLEREIASGNSCVYFNRQARLIKGHVGARACVCESNKVTFKKHVIPYSQVMLENQNRRIDDLLERIRLQQEKLDKQNVRIRTLQSQVGGAFLQHI